MSEFIFTYLQIKPYLHTDKTVADANRFVSAKITFTYT